MTLHNSDPDAAQRDKRHFQEPHISAEQHIRSRHLALGEEVTKKTRVYLDLKYWIYCREARAGRPEKPAHAEIWRILTQLAGTKQLICPVTYPILAEIRKQGNPDRRRETAKVVDVLSQRVAVQPYETLEGTELAHLWYSLLKADDALYPLLQLAWTFAGWLMGQPKLHVPALDDKIVNCMQKCIFDRLAAADFSMIVEALGDCASTQRDAYDELHISLNAATAQHRDEVTSFDAVFMSEVAGILDVMKPRIRDFLVRFMADIGQPATAPDSFRVQELARWATNLIYHAYHRKKLTTEFPVLHIGAGLHAAARLQDHPYKRGDLWDFRHAHPALAYCDAFFTEKKLGNLLCRSPLRYDRAYGCDVLWNDDEIVAYLRELVRTGTPPAHMPPAG